VTLDRLWAAWRSAYLGASGESEAEGGADAGSEPCVFCLLWARASGEAAGHVLYSGPLAGAVLNAFPYTSGHVLVMPRRHVGDLLDLDHDEADELWTVALDAMRAIRAAYHPDGVNLGANIGRAAGAGIPGHVHLHVLPRWYADTNFSTTVAGTRVIPEALEVTGDRLRAAWPH
jgi:diadenosine tetraphosphate (Ap4A) HIT family hydrolase